MAIGDGVSALASLGVTFGGFSPTAMDGVAASREYMEAAAAAEAKRKEARRKQRELEFARTSKPRTYQDDHGCVYTYVIVDERVVRIISCDCETPLIEVPASIEGLPVYAIGADAFSRNEFVEEIICPDTVERIGACAFRHCPKLRRVVLSASVDEFQASWLSHCAAIEELVLPGRLGKIDLPVFDSPALTKLWVGPEVNEIVPGAFQNTRLETVVVDERNPFIKTDGDAVYTHDGSVLLALARPLARYEVARGCTAIGKKAFYGIESLERVALPPSVTVIGEFAFSHSGITSFEAPESLVVLQDKAFFYCKQLTSVKLNEGLAHIGNSAFEQSALAALHIPASIESIGSSITAATNIVHSGPGCTIEIDAAAPSLFLDGEGGLYRREEDGVHMVQLIYREAVEYAAWPGVDVIDDYAFAFHPAIERVSFPEGLVRIGASAFRCSPSLSHVDIPDSVVEIGEEAFLDTSLESFRAPASLARLGKNALVTKAAHHGDAQPSLSHVEVAQGNEAFYVASGMLCQRKGATSSVVVFASSEPHVVIPDEVDHIEDYAFNNARGIEYLELGPNLKTIGTAGLMVWCWIEHVHVEVAEPIEGRTTFDFYFPNTSKGVHSLSLGVGGASWVNVPGIMVQYDNAIASAHDYNSPRNTDSISAYEQAKKMIERLEDPILLTETNRNLFDRVFRWNIIEICVDTARNDDRRLMERLIDFGYINEDNLEDVIGAVSKLQDAAMTGYLLEMKRLRFKRSAFDFDL